MSVCLLALSRGNEPTADNIGTLAAEDLSNGKAARPSEGKNIVGRSRAKGIDALRRILKCDYQRLR